MTWRSACASILAALVCACGGAPSHSHAERPAEPVVPVTLTSYPTRPIVGERAQIAGTVRDVQDGDPLVGVTVVLRSDPRDTRRQLTKGRTTVTDEHGRYQFEDVEPGRNYVVFFFLGSMAVGTLASATSGRETIVDGRIDTSRLEYEEVRVSAKSPRRH